MFSKRLRSVFSGILILVCVGLLSGCLKNKVLVKVKKDGSGTIVVTQIFSDKIVKIVDEQKKKFGSNGPILIDKQKIEFAAKSFGSGVKFKKMKELNRPDGSKGYIALYTFENIKDVKIPLSIMPDVNGSAVTFNFQTGKEGTSKLTVNPKKIEKSADVKDDKEKYPPHTPSAQDLQGIKQIMAIAGNPLGFSEKDSKEDMLRRMFSDTTFSIEIETTGTLVNSNASYPSKKKASRFTIAEVNLNDLMKSKKFLYYLAEYKNNAPEDLIRIMYSCPEGFRYDNQDEIVVEFK